MKITLQHAELTSSDLMASVLDILSSNHLLSMATVSESGKSHINTAYYSYAESLFLYILTEPTTIHAKNLVSRPSIAVTVFDSHQLFGSDLRGLQMFGKCEQIESSTARDAYRTYGGRYPILKEWVRDFDAYLNDVINSKFFKVDPTEVKIFDEPRFGKENFVVAEVIREAQ